MSERGPNGSPDYLHDASGAADPEVADLERALAPLRHDRPLDELAAAAAFARRARARRAQLASRVMPLAAAAVVAVLVGAYLLRKKPAPRAGWAVTATAGAPRAGDRALTGAGQLGVGEWLETDSSSRARLAFGGGKGEMEVAPATRLRLSRTGPQEHRIELAQGTISAQVDMPPRIFVVDTPAATATDLGCAYTLEVEPHGAGRLHVTSGWVELGRAERLSIVPAGALCELTPQGPATPRFEDASPDFTAALARFDRGDAGALDDILTTARLRDSLSLWHLLSRTPAADRARVLDRMLDLGALVPRTTTREAVLALDPKALDALQNALIQVWFPGSVAPDMTSGGKR